MKQISTGFGLAILGGCILGAAVLASPRIGSPAFAKNTGEERHIVGASVYAVGDPTDSIHIAYRIWSDNTIEIRNLGRVNRVGNGGINDSSFSNFASVTNGNFLGWKEVDNGMTTFIPTDVDASGEVDGGDVGLVLLDFGQNQSDNPPPPIDCSINSPR